MPFRFALNYFKQFSLDITIVLCLFAAKQIVDHSAFLVSPEAAIKKNENRKMYERVFGMAAVYRGWLAKL
jgi:hypothetical protein